MTSRLLRITTFVLLAAGSFLLADGCWIRTKAVLAQILLQHAWQESLDNKGKEVKPWPWADTWPVARLRVSRLGVDLIVLEGESGEVLAFGPGHLPGSSDIGDSGHVVLAGHRDTSFRFLQYLKNDDLVTVQRADGVTERYRITATGIYEAERLYLPQKKHAFLSMITCYPFDTVQPGTSLRYMVSAAPSAAAVNSVAEERL